MHEQHVFKQQIVYPTLDMKLSGEKKNMFQDSRWLTYKNGDNPATSIISESNQHGFTPIQVALRAEQW